VRFWRYQKEWFAVAFAERGLKKKFVRFAMINPEIARFFALSRQIKTCAS
jgi:hypothetical protein